MKLHGFGVAGREQESGAGSTFGADRAEQIGRLGPLIVSGPWPRALPGPTICELVLLADPHLVLEPHLYRCAGWELRARLRHASGEVSLKFATLGRWVGSRQATKRASGLG